MKSSLLNNQQWSKNWLKITVVYKINKISDHVLDEIDDEYNVRSVYSFTLIYLQGASRGGSAVKYKLLGCV